MANWVTRAWDWLMEDTTVRPVAPERRSVSVNGYNSVIPAGAVAAGVLAHGPGATELYAQAAGLTSTANSAVAACANAIQSAYLEATLRHYREAANGEYERIDASPVLALLASPNPHMTLRRILGYTQWCKIIAGNAYWLKIRGAGDAVIELWPVSPSLIKPVRDRDSRNFIDAYEYRPGPGRPIRFAPADVIHFRLGLCDSNHMLGDSPLQKLLREVATDEQASLFTDRLLRKTGVAGVVVTIPPGVEIDQATAEAIKARVRDQLTGENLGDVAVIQGGGNLQQFGFSPEQMNLTALHRLPEERIAAVIGVPAIIAGLGAGLERATYANYKEAREQFTEQTILPLYADDDDTLTQQLLREFTSDPREVLRHDTTAMRALQEDEDARFKRLNGAVAVGWMTPDEARAQIGLPALPNGAGAQPATKQPLTQRAASLETRGLSQAEIAALIEAERERAATRLEGTMLQYFDSQRKRIIEKARAG